MRSILSMLGVALWLVPGSATAEEGHHEHVAPHGGTLVVLGEEFAHVEFVLDPQAGELRAYVLDGEAEHGLRLAQKTLALRVEAPSSTEAPTRTDLALGAVANVLTGETVGATSEFRIRHERLRSLEKFHAEIASVEVKGRTFEGVAFDFPEGNEGDGEHAEEHAAASPTGGER